MLEIQYKLRCVFVCTDVYFFQKLLAAASPGMQIGCLGREGDLLLMTSFYSLDLYFHSDEQESLSGEILNPRVFTHLFKSQLCHGLVM